LKLVSTGRHIKAVLAGSFYDADFKKVWIEKNIYQIIIIIKINNKNNKNITTYSYCPQKFPLISDPESTVYQVVFIYLIIR